MKNAPLNDEVIFLTNSLITVYYFTFRENLHSYIKNLEKFNFWLQFLQNLFSIPE